MLILSICEGLQLQLFITFLALLCETKIIIMWKSHISLLGNHG